MHDFRGGGRGEDFSTAKKRELNTEKPVTAQYMHMNDVFLFEVCVTVRKAYLFLSSPACQDVGSLFLNKDVTLLSRAPGLDGCI